jgi:hypothetical protein
MKLITWEKNEIKVDVLITAKGGTEEKLNRFWITSALKTAKIIMAFSLRQKWRTRKNWKKRRQRI